VTGGATSRRAPREPRRSIDRLSARNREMVSTTMTTATIARGAVFRANGATVRLSRGGVGSSSYPSRTHPSRSSVVVRAETSAETLIGRAKTLTDDLKAMKTSMPTIRRVVAGSRNDLKALQLYQDALEGKVPDDYDTVTKLESVLDDLASYVQDKAEEEQFWADREGKVTSSMVDNANLSEDEKRELSGMVANTFMWGVQGAVWNALILLIGFVSLVTFVLPNQ
jgi:hypothetical protein